MIRPYLRDLVNEHKPIAELNNNNNNNRAERKIQLTMRISFISTRSFKLKRTMHPKSKPTEVFMGSDTKNVIDTLFNTLLQRFQKSQETSTSKRKRIYS